MAMNFMVYPVGMLGFWMCGFAIMMGGLGGAASLGGGGALANEFTINLFGKDFGLFGSTGFFLSGSAYDAVIFSLFLFQMVFMDTTATIPAQVNGFLFSASGSCLRAPATPELHSLRNDGGFFNDYG